MYFEIFYVDETRNARLNYGITREAAPEQVSEQQ